MEVPKVKPTTGQGATRLVGSDRYACTVIDVTESGKTVWVQDDTATRTDSNAMSDSQSYTYAPNPKGEITRFRFTRHGWTARGQRLALGVRNHYYDYSF